MLPTVFYFDFQNDYFDENDKTITSYGFIISSEGTENILRNTHSVDFKEFIDSVDSDDALLAYSQDIESDYGVHDWGTSPDPRVNAIGYGTYEVEKSKIAKLMNTWREVFVKLAGADNVSQVVQLSKTGNGGGNDFDVYTEIYNLAH
jgi:hypothetical protein